MSVVLEAKAQEAWHELGHNAPEFVGLGLVVDLDAEGAPETIIWYELENTAESGEFYVSGEELTRVFEQAEDERSDWALPLHGILLWHSHYRTTEPSQTDLDAFPAWLCDAGVIYHAPTGTTTLYNAGGIISNSAQPAAPLVTKPQERI